MKFFNPIYLDNNATTALDPMVLKRMLEDLEAGPLNPSSIHHFGQKARQKLSLATQEIASFFNISPQEIIYTSGATEALNMIISGICERQKGGHIITSTLEHAAVFNSIQNLVSKKKVQATFLAPYDKKGVIELEQIKEAVTSKTHTIVLMAANNETGALTDLESIAAFAEGLDIQLIVDGVALLGKEKLVFYSGISALCFSGHKIHGPKGIGIAVTRKKLKWEPLVYGGPQQNGRRGGTENLAGILGIAEAIRQLTRNGSESFEKMRLLRNKLENSLKQNLPEIIVHCPENRVSNISNIAFLGVDGESLLMRLDLMGVALSHGSACQSGALEPSRVLIEMGVGASIARSSIRFSLSRYTTEEEIDRTVNIVSECVRQLRSPIGSKKLEDCFDRDGSHSIDQ